MQKKIKKIFFTAAVAATFISALALGACNNAAGSDNGGTSSGLTADEARLVNKATQAISTLATYTGDDVDENIKGAAVAVSGAASAVKTQLNGDAGRSVRAATGNSQLLSALKIAMGQIETWTQTIVAAANGGDASGLTNIKTNAEKLTDIVKSGNPESITKTVEEIGGSTVPDNPKPQIPDGFVLVEGDTVQGNAKYNNPAAPSWQTPNYVFMEGRTVTIKSFYISDHEVTQTEYETIMGKNPSNFKSDVAAGEVQENRPVEQVNWYDALVYCNKRSIAEELTPVYTIGGSTNPSDWGDVPTSSNATWNAAIYNLDADGYRLPTEVEWEYAARGGKDGMEKEMQTQYAGSNNIDEVAWYNDSENKTQNKTHEVKTKQANTLGIFDMSGNVREWCWDWYTTIKTSTPDIGPTSAYNRVHRGGSFSNWDEQTDCTVYKRGSGDTPYTRENYIGFRVVRTAQ